MLLEIGIVIGVLWLMRQQKPFSMLPVIAPPRISQRFKGAAHEGIDFDVAIGDPLYSIGRGVVGATGEDGTNGKWIRLDLGGGGETYQVHYLHCNRVILAKDSPVEAGEIVAEGGNTGRVRSGPGGDGSHLHLEIHRMLEDGSRVLVDPASVLPLDESGNA
jgi:murein DD-endopeptidase MepM/ murein hydrolase activator NlpD